MLPLCRSCCCKLSDGDGHTDFQTYLGNIIFMVLRLARVGLSIALVAGGASLARLGDAFSGLGPIGEARFLGVLICAIAVVAVALASPRSPSASPSISAWMGMVILMHLWVAASSLWAEHSAFTATQLYEIGLLCTTLLLSFHLFKSDPSSAVRLLLISFYILSAVFLLASLVLSGGLSGELSALGAGGIGAARVLGMGVIAATFLFFESGKRMWLLPVPFWAAGMLMTGSRATVLALPVGLAYIWWQRRSVVAADRVPARRSVIRSVLLVGLFVVIGSTLGSQLVSGFAQSLLTGDQSGAGQQLYLADRDVIFTEAWFLFLSRPALGIGLGTYVGPFGEIYPHNILLGFAVDAGFVGLFSCGALLLYSLLKGHKTLTRTGHGAVASAGFFLAAAMFAGTYYDNRFVWIFLLLTLMIADREHLARLVNDGRGRFGVWILERDVSAQSMGEFGASRFPAESDNNKSMPTSSGIQ